MTPGTPMWWMHTPRGGYGYTRPVPAWVVRVAPKRLGIAALTDSGCWKPVWVAPEHLREREAAA